MANPKFATEFRSLILADDTFINGWANVWIVAGVTALDAAVCAVVSKLCMPENIAFMEPASAEDLIKLVRNRLTIRLVKVDPPVTDVQWEHFKSAVNGSTPAAVITFIERAIVSAMGWMPLCVTETIDIGPKSSPQRPTISPSPVHAPAQDDNLPSIIATRAIGSTSVVASVDQAFNGTSPSNDKYDLILVWDRDVETKYETVSGRDTHNGIAQSRIPGSDSKYITREEWNDYLRKETPRY